VAGRAGGVARARLAPYGGGVGRALRRILRFARVLLAGAVLFVATAPTLAPVAEPWMEAVAFVASASAGRAPREARRAVAPRAAPRAVPVVADVADIVRGMGPARVAPRAVTRLHLRHCALLC
jgi:hypothetical protein